MISILLLHTVVYVLTIQTACQSGGKKNPHNLIVMDTVWGFSHKTFFRSNITAVPVFSSLGECPGTSEEDGFLKSAEGAPANTFSKKYMMRH